MRLLTRVFVLVLAVALVPLLRFIELDACSNPSAAPYPVEGLSGHDSNGVVVDRKSNVRFIARGRTALDGDGSDDLDETQWSDLPDAEPSFAATSTSQPPPASASSDPASAHRTAALARGPPRA